MSRLFLEKISGDRGVRIHGEQHGDKQMFGLMWIHSGWKWSGAGADAELLDAELLRMIRDTCDLALNNLNENKPDQQNEQ